MSKVIRAEAETSLEVMNKRLFMLLLFLMKIDNFVLTKVPNIQNTRFKLVLKLKYELSLAKF